MSTTGIWTVRKLCTAALRKINVVAQDEPADADSLETARGVFEVMHKALQMRGANIYTLASQTLTLTTAASYSLSPVRPIEILNARFKRDGQEIPMHRMTRDEYDTLPDKDTTGVPTNFYYDRQREAALFYVWPVLSAASGETVEITYRREIEDADSLNDVVDAPVEWYEALIYNLAARLCDDFSVTGERAARIEARAAQLLRLAEAHDSEGSVFFGYGPDH